MLKLKNKSKNMFYSIVFYLLSQNIGCIFAT